jgi:hypothetical protein
MSYGINLFKDEVLCDVIPLKFCDILLEQPYMWKRHVVYESRPRTVIITLGRKLYGIPKFIPTTTISLITAKQCRKAISQTGKNFLFMAHYEGEHKIIMTLVLTQDGHPVAYHSETLSDSIHKYPTYDKEMYSIVQACYQWKHYILGKETTIHIYHKSL